jgi:hypothetical protein
MPASCLYGRHVCGLYWRRLANGRMVQATNSFQGGRELFDLDYQYISSDDATFVGWYQAFAWVG